MAVKEPYVYYDLLEFHVRQMYSAIDRLENADDDYRQVFTQEIDGPHVERAWRSKQDAGYYLHKVFMRAQNMKIQVIGP